MDTVSSNALRALIDQSKARNDWSDEDIAQRATQRGHRLNKQEVSNFRLQVRSHLVPAKVTALAAGMDVQPYLVAIALLADLGIQVPVDTRTPEAAVQHDPSLSAKARRFLTAIIVADRED